MVIDAKEGPFGHEKLAPLHPTPAITNLSTSSQSKGCTVTVISRSASKKAFATQLGAKNLVVSTDEDQMNSAKSSLDIILNTVPSYHDYLAYQPLLDRKSHCGRQVLLGLHKGLAGAFVVNTITGDRSRILGSGIGSIKATQEVIDLCAEKGIRPEIEIMPCSKLNEIYGLLDKNNETGKRYVLDIENTLKEGVKADDPAPELQVPTSTMAIPGILAECCKLLWCCFWCR